MTEIRLIQRAPHWRVLLNSFAIAAAFCTHAGSAAAATPALVISGTPPSTVTAGSSYSFTPTVTGGASGRTLSFAIVQKPSWATFNGATGKLSGTPTAANVGSYKDIAIGVNNGLTSAISKNFSIQVAAGGTTKPTTPATPTPPASTPSAPSTGKLTISGTPPASVAAGSSYSFTPAVSGGGGRTLSFDISQKPSWATFSGTTGKLTGTPTSANVGTSQSILIMVNNGLSVALLQSFHIQVTASGSKPVTPPAADTVTISGTPATSVTAGSKYAFQPSARDSLGKSVSYSVQHAPSWASFSIASGLLSGTPASTQTGTYSGIIISASDGTASSSLPAFAITVKSLAVATGSATLSWTDPTKNTDGSPLTNMAGVNIHYGTSPSNLSQEITVAGTGMSGYTISNLGAGTWYFGAAVYTTTGLEGAMSQIGSKTIQ